MNRRILTTALIAASLAVPGGAQAAEDPERNSTTPTGWHWWRNQSEVDLNGHANASKERIVDIEVESTNPYRFTAALVRNDGTYARGWSWWFGFTAQDVKDKIKEEKSRIIDLERYTDAAGKRRFAFVTVRNKNGAKKGWWWNYDLTASQVTDGIKEHKVRLVDLDSYLVGGKRRYSYVGIKNKGDDKRAWWWYRNVSPKFVADRLKEHKARLIDIERPKTGKLSVVMVKQKQPSAYWWYAYALTQAQLEELYQVHGVRIADIERYTVNGSTRYAFVGISNVGQETRRLRALIEKAYSNTDAFGTKTIRGVYVKQVNGPVLANLAGNLRFQPLSTLKLLPYTYAIERIDQEDESLNTLLTWTQASNDDPETDVDETKYASCLTPDPPNTHNGRAQFRHALPTMMWESHNRTLDAFLARYTPKALTDRAQDVWGLKSMEMYQGCPSEESNTPWSANRSTLADFGRLFEGVDNKQILKKQESVDLFYDNMINIDYAGASYTSPITDKTTGPLYNSSLEDIVKREAGPQRQGNVNEFMQSVALRGKGGSGGPSGNEIGYSDFLHVTLPTKAGGNFALKSYVVGWFVYKLKSPAGCPESMAKDGGTCEAIWKPEKADLAKLRREMHALPIRLAMKTWPENP